MPRLIAVVAVVLSVPLFVFAADPPSAEQTEFFEKHVRPLLVEQCVSCHGPKKQRAGLRLDTADGLKKGADEGPVVVAGDPDKSSLIQAVRRKGEYPMPPDKPMTAEQVAVLEAWVKGGAVFPAGATKAVAADWKQHWAFQPPREPSVPEVASGKEQGANPIDAFVAARMAKEALKPAPKADKRTLARRAYFDLLGLPPTADELDAFVKDTDPKAWDKLIDKLLASPHYGERWGRHWLDVARYADSKGYVFTEDRNYPYAYTYRDYVIRSFNEDKPFDRFVTEQLAADKLTLGDDKKALAAMGFLTVGRRFSNNIHDITDDRIDVVTRGLMGLTVTCARCHDHKFDPIPAADYYSLYGVFASSNEPKDLPQIGEPDNKQEFEKFKAEHAKLEQAVADEGAKRLAAKKQGVAGLVGGIGFQPPEQRLLNRADRDEIAKLQRKADKFRAESPGAPPRAMVMVDNPRPAEQVVFLRGNPGNRGPKVVPQMPVAVAGEKRAAFKDGSGRLEMAKAIASKDNPLTARVFVNRVWAWHFGAGLVRTTSDFGLRTERPSHPELLDWLTLRFVEDGWSVKKLHRRIMQSDAYTRSSVTTPEAAKVDPENKWLSHFTRTRHDFEAMRDSLLSASGTLDRTVYGRSVDLFKPPFSKRRAVYGSIDRQNLPGTLQAFDFASPEQHTPQRFQTTVPQQALFLLNSPFVAEAARAVVTRVEAAKALAPALSTEAEVKLLYRAVLSRSPTKEEAELAVEFVTVAEKEKAEKGKLTAWEQLAQVLLMSNEFAFVD
jgi:mono/diheme cytochrome c family protein